MMNEDVSNVEKKVILPINAQVVEIQVDLEEDQCLAAVLAQNQALLVQEVQISTKHTAQDQVHEIDYMDCYNNDK